MKILLGAAMTAALALAACAPPPPPAPAATAASADQTQTASAQPPKKKRCAEQTGSRLAPCGDGSTGDYVQGSSGDSYRQDMMGKSVGGIKPQ